MALFPRVFQQLGVVVVCAGLSAAFLTVDLCARMGLFPQVFQQSANMYGWEGWRMGIQYWAMRMRTTVAGMPWG